MKSKRIMTLTFALLLFLSALPVSARAADDAAAEEEDATAPLLDIYAHMYSATDLGEGTFYNCPNHAFYIPAHIDENTKSVIYYPGGCGEPMLRVSLALQYVTDFAPNAIIVFMRHSGYDNIPKKVEESWQVLETICREYKTEIRDLVITGPSNGGYTALKAIPYLYDKHQLRTEFLLVMDMGLNFLVGSLFPTEEECKTITEIGTEIYFFDQRYMDRENPQLKVLESRGLQFHMVYCTKDEHIQIARDEFSQGVISWALGEIKELNPDYYEFE